MTDTAGGKAAPQPEQKDFLFVIVNDETKSKNETIRQVLAHARRSYLKSKEHKTLQAQRQAKQRKQQQEQEEKTKRGKQAVQQQQQQPYASNDDGFQYHREQQDQTRSGGGTGRYALHHQQQQPTNIKNGMAVATVAPRPMAPARSHAKALARLDDLSSHILYPELATYMVDDYTPGWSVLAWSRVSHHIDEITKPLRGTRFEVKGPNVLNDGWLLAAKGQPVLFHALVFLCSHAARRDLNSTNYLFHRGKTLELIRETLSVKYTSTVSADETIATVALMAMAEFILGDYTNLAHHMSGMRLLIEQRGGPEKLGFQGHLHKLLIEYHTLSCLFNDLEVPFEYREHGPVQPVSADLQMFTWDDVSPAGSPNSSTSLDFSGSYSALSAGSVVDMTSGSSNGSTSSNNTPSPPPSGTMPVPSSTKPGVVLGGGGGLHPYSHTALPFHLHPSPSPPPPAALSASSPDPFHHYAAGGSLSPSSPAPSSAAALVAPEVRSLLLLVSSTAASWDAACCYDPWSSVGGVGGNVASALLVERDAADLHAAFAAATPLTYRAQACRLAGLLFAMAPGKGAGVVVDFVSANNRAAPAVSNNSLEDVDSSVDMLLSDVIELGGGGPAAPVFGLGGGLGGGHRPAPSSSSPSATATVVPASLVTSADFDLAAAAEGPHGSFGDGGGPAAASLSMAAAEAAAAAAAAGGASSDMAHGLATTTSSTTTTSFAAQSLALGKEHVLSLQRTLKNSDMDPCWEEVPGALIWCLLVGAYASKFTGGGFWFRKEIKRVLLTVGLSKWQDMVRSLRIFAWLIRCRYRGMIVPR